MLIYSFIPILLLSITEVGASRSPPRYLDSHDLYGPDGSCNDVVSTNPDANGVAGVGIVFPIQSHVDNDDDVLVSSTKIVYQQVNSFFPPPPQLIMVPSMFVSPYDF